jgi:hypothetical protein
MSERTGYLTEAEIAAVQHLHKRAPYAICGVSHGMFSVARHYGGMTFNRCRYTYIPEHDECVRADVLRLVKKMRKKTPSKPQAEGDIFAALEAAS